MSPDQTISKLQYENQEVKLQLQLLEKAVKEMMAAKDVWISDRNNENKRKVFFAKEKIVKEILNPKPKQVSQAKIDWLAQ